jgi:hypothetical protein
MCGVSDLEVGGHGLVVLVVTGEAVAVRQPHAACARLQALRLAQVPPRELALTWTPESVYTLTLTPLSPTGKLLKPYRYE